VIRAVIFDLGHTLWDWDTHMADPVALDRAYAAARATLCARLGTDDLPSADELRRAVGAALREDGETYFNDPGRVDQPPTHTWVDRGWRSLGLELDETLLRELTPPLFATEIHGLICGAGTIEAVRELDRDGYALGCVTNTLADEVAIRDMLRLYEIEDLMSCVVVSAEVGLRKPHRALFEQAMRALGIEQPADAVFVGDSPWHDIAGAAAAGMRTVLTTQYVTRSLDGCDAHPDAVIAHLRELRGVIAALDRAG
jgi:HAD superfamily hydrolase (TIGR01509 family)